MTDDSKKQILTFVCTLAAVFLGSAMQWLGSYFADRRKASIERRVAFRSACTRWLTSIKIVTHQLNGLIALMNSVPENIAIYKSLLDETKIVLASMKECFQAHYETNLLDDIKIRRELYSEVTSLLDSMYGVLQDEVEYLRVHVDAKESVDVTMQMVLGLPDACEWKAEKVNQANEVFAQCKLVTEKHFTAISHWHDKLRTYIAGLNEHIPTCVSLMRECP